MKILAFIIVVIAIGIIAKNKFFGFSAQKPADYANTGPAISLVDHLNGPILSEGLIYGPTGSVTNSFTAKMHGAWDGNRGTLTEDFIYSNGETQSRKWHLTLSENDAFTAAADDIVGTATGVVSGSTIMMRYQIILPERAGGHKLWVTDWLYLTESGVILNRSEMRKFGIKVAELVATMRPSGTP